MINRVCIKQNGPSLETGCLTRVKQMETLWPIATVNSEFTAPGNQSQVAPVNMILSGGGRFYFPKMAAKLLEYHMLLQKFSMPIKK